jgi:hypothetical protein
MPQALRGSRQQVPSSLGEWLEKWEPKISSFKRKSKKDVTSRASYALDELEFLLARTVENSVSE